jgi:hypothetical protein
VVDAAVEHPGTAGSAEALSARVRRPDIGLLNADSSVSSAPTCTVVPVEATQTLNASPSITGLWPELFGKHPENTGR